MNPNLNVKWTPPSPDFEHIERVTIPKTISLILNSISKNGTLSERIEYMVNLALLHWKE